MDESGQKKELDVQPINDKNSLLTPFTQGKWKKYSSIILAILGCLPWVGAVLNVAATTVGAATSFSSQNDQQKLDELQKLWLNEHREKIQDLWVTISEILSRIDGFGEEVQNRISSPEYLALVRKTFRSWDQADTVEKRSMLKKLITNAAAIKLCPDDLIRLFISWIDQYHESHFLVIKKIYQNPGITRGQIWNEIHGQRPRDDSAEADLFRYLIDDLSRGRVIRQQRASNSTGQFLKQSTRKTSRKPASQVMESAFEDTKPYSLTGLGKQFVHYVMEDVVPQIGPN